MTRAALPEAERRGQAVRMACRTLLANEVRLLPPDPLTLGREMGFEFRTMSALAEEEKANPHEFVHHTVGEEAFTICAGGKHVIVYDDTVRSPERIRFSILHEFGHILMEHFESRDLNGLTLEQARVLEDEANTFARNFLCPPPVLDLVRGDLNDPRYAALFCMSRQAWQVRVRTLNADRRYIDQRTADLLRIQFREYMFGRRCRDCGAVFTDETRQGRCPRCGGTALRWNPEMETRERAGSRRHVAGATAEDLRPRVGEMRETDYTGYWELIRKENRK